MKTKPITTRSGNGTGSSTVAAAVAPAALNPDNNNGNDNRLGEKDDGLRDPSTFAMLRPISTSEPSSSRVSFNGTDIDDQEGCFSLSSLSPRKNNLHSCEELAEEDKELFTYNELALEGYPNMANIRGQGGLCDIKIKVGDNTILAHRIVLAATIPYFHAMFLTDMKESKQEEIELYSLDFDALEALINFAYTGEIQINVHNVQRVMMVAAFLQMNKVKEACARFLIKRLTLENVIGVRSFAENLNCSDVVIESDRFIQKNFFNVCKNEEFLQLSQKDVCEILDRNELHIESEEQVFQIMMDWVKKDEEIRSMYLPELLKCVRMPLLTPQFISDHVAAEPLIRSSHQCRDLLDEVRDYYLMPERRSSLQTFKTQPRCCDDIVGYIYVVGGLTKSGSNVSCNTHSGSSCTLCDSISTVEMYDPILERWQVVDAMRMLRSRVGVAVMQNRLFAVGGYNGIERLADAEVYDTSKNNWSKIPCMHYKRSAVGCCSFNGQRLYVCGGYDGTTSLRTVECYFPESNRWAMMAPMIKHRSAAGVVALGHYVYAIGGHDGMSIFDSVERFDTRIGVWSMVAPMKTKRCRLGAAVLQNKIFCVGGYDGSYFLKSVEMYDPLTDMWTEVAPMSLVRSRVALVNNAGKLYAIGGYDGASNLSTVEVYDPNKDSWKLISSMCAHEGGVGAATVPIDAI